MLSPALAPIILACVFGIVVQAKPQSEKPKTRQQELQERYEEAADHSAKTEIAALESEIRNLTATSRDKKTQANKRKEQMERIKLLKTRLERWNTGELKATPKFDVVTAKVGYAGYPFVNGKEAVGKVLQIVGPQDLILKFDERLIWLTGYPTSDLTDDNLNLRMNSPFYVSGTKSYATALGGSKTVLVFEVIVLPKKQKKTD